MLGCLEPALCSPHWQLSLKHRWQMNRVKDCQVLPDYTWWEVRWVFWSSGCHQIFLKFIHLFLESREQQMSVCWVAEWQGCNRIFQFLINRVCFFVMHWAYLSTNEAWNGHSRDVISRKGDLEYVYIALMWPLWVGVRKQLRREKKDTYPWSPAICFPPPQATGKRVYGWWESLGAEGGLCRSVTSYRLGEHKPLPITVSLKDFWIVRGVELPTNEWGRTQTNMALLARR